VESIASSSFKAKGFDQHAVFEEGGRRGGESEPLPGSLAEAQRPARCTWKEGNELHGGKKGRRKKEKRKESEEFRKWREEHNVIPWVKTRPRADKHVEIRASVKGKKKRMEIIRNYYYLFDCRDVATMFKSTVEYYSNIGLVFRNKESGEYKRMAICSRWNTRKDEWYKKRYWDIYDSVKDEKKITMLSIGYDQRRMFRIMEESDWKGDFYGYLMGRIGDDINKFLKRLRSFLKRQDKDWTYRGYAIEPHEASGLPHIHFYFKGNWIAEIDDIVRLWGWSQTPGIKVTVRTGSEVAGYLSHYLKKAIDCVRGDQVHLLYAYAYFFGIPLYRVAYGKRKQNTEDLDYIEIDEKDVPITKSFVRKKWKCIGICKISDDEWDGTFKPFREEKYMSIETYEEFYMPIEPEGPKEIIWWHDYPKRGLRKNH
jgi:hypothetical protein